MLSQIRDIRNMLTEIENENKYSLHGGHYTKAWQLKGYDEFGGREISKPFPGGGSTSHKSLFVSLVSRR